MAPPLRLALFEPDIAGNVGTLIRLGACLGLGIDLIEPMGFAFGDRSLARAGMDYAAHADIARHADWSEFRAAVGGRLVLVETDGAVALPQARFLPGDVLLFGAESAGVPRFVYDAAAASVRIPLVPGRRSLNVAVAAAIATGEALRQIKGWPTAAI